MTTPTSTTTRPTRRPRYVDDSLSGRPRSFTVQLPAAGLPVEAVDAIADVRGRIAANQAEARQTGEAITAAERELAGARGRDVDELAKAIAAGKPDPTPSTPAAEQRIVELKRRSSALQLLRTGLEAELADALDAGRDDFLEAARRDVADGTAALRTALDELRERWTAVAASASAARFLERWPNPGKQPGVVVMGHVAGLLGPGDSAYDVGRVLAGLDASVAELEGRVDPEAHPLKPPARLGHAVDPSEVFIPAAIEPDDDPDDDLD
jgi:hypothetical protein